MLIFALSVAEGGVALIGGMTLGLLVMAASIILFSVVRDPVSRRKPRSVLDASIFWLLTLALCWSMILVAQWSGWFSLVDTSPD